MSIIGYGIKILHLGEISECRKQRDGLLPIFGVGLRPRNGVAIGWAWCARQASQARRATERARAAAHATKLACSAVHATELARAAAHETESASDSASACHNTSTALATGFLGPQVMTSNFVSRHGRG